MNYLQLQFGLKIDEFGILQCHQTADIPERTKSFRLLASQEHFTELLIQYVHDGLIYAGVAHTMSPLHQEY